MEPTTSRPGAWLLRQRTVLGKLSRYTAASVVAFAASQLTFLVTYGLELTGPQGATVLAFCAGVPVNYLLNRRWAWQQRGRPRLRAELLPYAAIILVSVGLAATATSAVDRWLTAVEWSRPVEVVLVAVAFALTQGGLFIGKFVLFDRLVFRDRRSLPRSSGHPERVL